MQKPRMKPTGAAAQARNAVSAIACNSQSKGSRAVTCSLLNFAREKSFELLSGLNLIWVNTTGRVAKLATAKLNHPIEGSLRPSSVNGMSKDTRPRVALDIKCQSLYSPGSHQPVEVDGWGQFKHG